MYGVSAQTAHKPVHQSTIVLIYIPCIQDIHSARSVEKFVEIIKSMNFVGVSGRINFPKVNGVHGHSRRSNIKVSSLSLLPKILYAQFYIELGLCAAMYNMYSIYRYILPDNATSGQILYN